MKILVDLLMIFSLLFLSGYTTCSINMQYCVSDCQAFKQSCMEYCRTNNFKGLDNSACRHVCNDLGQTCIQCEES